MRGLRIILRWLRSAIAATAIIIPAAAWADCEVVTEETLLHEPNAALGEVVVPIDPGGVRTALSRRGIAIGAEYVGEVFTNSGGFDQGTEYDGVLEMHMNADMKRLGLWKGLCFHANAFQIYGNSITAANIGSLMPVSGLEATDATRLFELWFEQHMYDEKLNVRFGQLAADEEFLIADGGGFFLNGTWGWPSYTAADMPNGGPAYPLATPGVRVAVAPTEKLTILAAVYNGDPVGPNCNEDPQVCNGSGTDFRLDDPPLLMVEGQYKYNQDRLAGTIKLGGWNHFGSFEDQRFDVGGALIAVTGQPALVHGDNYGFYGIIDQLIWRVPGSEDPKGVGVFARFMGAPTDRNLIDFYADGGVTFSGMIPGRPDDALAIGFAYTGISDDAGAFDVDTGLAIARNYEALLEICYTFQIKEGWALQPDFQYIWQPGGNVPDESGRKSVENAAVFGARTTLAF